MHWIVATSLLLAAELVAVVALATDVSARSGRRDTDHPIDRPLDAHQSASSAQSESEPDRADASPTPDDRRAAADGRTGASSGAARRLAPGLASIYGYGGRRTASGERLDQSGLTAAHRTLPFGTMVQVTNRSNGRSVVVRINDRGPFIRGRVIDVTPAAARVLGFSGLVGVSLAVMGRK